MTEFSPFSEAGPKSIAGITHPSAPSSASETEHCTLEHIIGEAGLVALAAEFGGSRLYVPVRIASDHRIAKAVGIDAARALCDQYRATVIRVPLARDLRAKHYRAMGWSAAKIARTLGLSESGTRSLFKRLDRQA